MTVDGRWSRDSSPARPSTSAITVINQRRRNFPVEANWGKRGLYIGSMGFDNDGHKPRRPATNILSERRYDREFAVNLAIS